MPKTAAQLLEDALHLPDVQRMELAWGLLDSLEPAPGTDRSEEEWLAEIERRARAARAGERGVPWEEVKAEIYQRLGRS